ncbi:MAG: iron dicitrate transport regulator FecR [Rhizobiales bacterium]|nr:iron dicitrate transport regulator FecR [Hyphomicrobiales bacterium]MBA69948.1 iron dicitrate transport regulator FecR [Hyphomicrobiales bacterium]
MTGDEQTPDHADERLSDEAIDWLVRLNSGKADRADHAGFALWRAQSDAHERAAAEAEALWYGIGRAGDERRATARRRHTRRAVLGAGLVATGGLAAYQAGLIREGLFADHVTGTGETRVIDLADGSRVRMNAASALSLDLGPDLRRLELHYGQAIFEVAHDPDRPFIVEAGGGRTRAIGTAFDIDVRPDSVVVTVLEGVVGVSRSGDRAEGVTASANHHVRYGEGEGIGAAVPVDADTATAWRRGKLIFNNRPLGEVVTELDRQIGGRIVIANRRLANLEVTGVFDLENPQSVLDAISRSLPVKVVRLPLLTVLR